MAHLKPHSDGPAGVLSPQPSWMQERGQQEGDGWGVRAGPALAVKVRGLRMASLAWSVWRLALLTMRLTLPTLEAATM